MSGAMAPKKLLPNQLTLQARMPTPTLPSVAPSVRPTDSPPTRTSCSATDSESLSPIGSSDSPPTVRLKMTKAAATSSTPSQYLGLFKPYLEIDSKAEPKAECGEGDVDEESPDAKRLCIGMRQLNLFGKPLVYRREVEVDEENPTTVTVNGVTMSQHAYSQTAVAQENRQRWGWIGVYKEVLFEMMTLFRTRALEAEGGECAVDVNMLPSFLFQTRALEAEGGECAVDVNMLPSFDSASEPATAENEPEACHTCHSLLLQLNPPRSKPAS